jgi:hypothetical protein
MLVEWQVMPLSSLAYVQQTKRRLAARGSSSVAARLVTHSLQRQNNSAKKRPKYAATTSRINATQYWLLKLKWTKPSPAATPC